MWTTVKETAVPIVKEEEFSVSAKSLQDQQDLGAIKYSLMATIIKVLFWPAVLCNKGE